MQSGSHKLRCERDDARIAVWQAARLSTSTTEGPNGYRMYTNIFDEYFAILGSPNGASTLRMLIDQKEQIGYQTQKRIFVFGCTESEGQGDSEEISTVVCDGGERTGEPMILTNAPEITSFGPYS